MPVLTAERVQARRLCAEILFNEGGDSAFLHSFAHLKTIHAMGDALLKSAATEALDIMLVAWRDDERLSTTHSRLPKAAE